MSDGPALSALIQEYQQAKTGDRWELASEAIVRHVDPHFCLFLYGRCWPSDLGDILQEAWVAIFRKLDAFVSDTDRKAWAWFYTVLRNKLTDYLRTRTRNPAAPWTDPAVLMAIIEESALEEPLSPQQRARLEAALAKLEAASPHCAEYFWLHFVMGMTYEELGAIYGASEDAMRMRIRNCLTKAGIQTEARD